jgi:hypothetical protein
MNHIVSYKILKLYAGQMMFKHQHVPTCCELLCADTKVIDLNYV